MISSSTRNRTRWTAAAMIALCAGAGCAIVREAELALVPTLPLALPPGSLAAEFDRPSDELVPLIMEEEGAEEERASEEAEVVNSAEIPVDRARSWIAALRAGRYGVRAGGLSTQSSSKTTWAPRGFLGAYYRNDRFWKSWFAYELGLDIAAISGDSGDGGSVAGSISFLRLDALFGNWREDTRDPAFYGMFGFASGGERATWEPTGELAQSSAGVIELGFGVSGADGSWDARVAYLVFIGSENARGAATVGMGVSF